MKLVVILALTFGAFSAYAQSGPRFSPRPSQAVQPSAPPPVAAVSPSTGQPTQNPPVFFNQPVNNPNLNQGGFPSYGGVPSGIQQEPLSKPDEEVLVKKLGKINGKHIYKAQDSALIFLVKKESDVQGKRVPVTRSSATLSDPSMTTSTGSFENANKRNELPSMVGTAGPR